MNCDEAIRGELWTVREAAEQLGVSEKLVRSWVDRKLIVPPIRRPIRLWSDDLYDCQHDRAQPPARDSRGRFARANHTAVVCPASGRTMSAGRKASGPATASTARGPTRLRRSPV